MESAASTTIAFVPDARPIHSSSNSVLIEDLDQIIPHSPDGQVDAVVMVGDMDPIDSGTFNTIAAYSESTAKNIPSFFVVGNHEVDANNYDMDFIRSRFSEYSFTPNPGPAGTSNTTYSFNVGDIHVVVLNEYWDGDSDPACAWYIPDGRANTGDACFKYSTDDGGFIPDALFTWLENDLNANTRNWTVVVGHEPLYPQGTNHVGNSLDEDATNRDRLQNLFISKDVTAFIGAHTHQSNLTTIDTIIHADAGVVGTQAHRVSPPNDP